MTKQRIATSAANIANHVAAIVAGRPEVLRDICGERAGTRTQDPVSKSHVLYRLSYALPGEGLGHGGLVSKPKTRLPAQRNRPIPQRFKYLRWIAPAIAGFVTRNTSAGAAPA